MKKIPKSITVTVRHHDEDLTATGTPFVTTKELLEGAFGTIPGTDYRVTYTVNPRGLYQVQDESFMAIYSAGTGSFRKYVCFLPRSWHGLRVSRRVTPIRGKK